MTCVVLDASAAVEYLLRTQSGTLVAATLEQAAVDLHAPSLCDIEVASALRSLVIAKKLSIARAREVLADYTDLPITRHGHVSLLVRMLDLHDNMSAYDATYVALAESLDAVLVTCDVALSKAVKAHLPDLDVTAFGD